MKRSLFLQSAILGGALIGFSSCLIVPKLEDAKLAFYQKGSASTTATTGIGAFQSTYYAFARANCASCHGVAQPPLFASASLDSSYGVAKDPAYVSFTSPASSKLAIYSGNGHCGQPGCATNSANATAQITAWAAVENGVSTGGGGTGGVDPTGGGGPSTGGVNPNAFVTVSMPIPTTISSTGYVPIRWQMSQLTPTAPALVTGAIFEVEIQKLSATTYRVRNPKLAGLRSIVRVTGIHVLVKPSTDPGYGVEDLGAGSVWENDVVNVAISTLPNTLPTTPLSTTTFPVLDSFANIIGVRSNQDSLTIAFDRLEAGAAVTPTFAYIKANILDPKCLSCHNSGNALGGVSYSTYNSTLTSVVAGNPAGSRLFVTTSGTNPSMPTGSLKLSAAETGAISTWISAGAANN